MICNFNIMVRVFLNELTRCFAAMTIGIKFSITFFLTICGGKGRKFCEGGQDRNRERQKEGRKKRRKQQRGGGEMRRKKTSGGREKCLT